MVGDELYDHSLSGTHVFTQPMGNLEVICQRSCLLLANGSQASVYYIVESSRTRVRRRISG